MHEVAEEVMEEGGRGSGRGGAFGEPGDGWCVITANPKGVVSKVSCGCEAVCVGHHSHQFKIQVGDGTAGVVG